MENNNNIKKFELVQEFIESQREIWEISEERLMEMFKYNNENIVLQNQEFYINGYGQKPFDDFMTLESNLKDENRYIEVAYILENIILLLIPKFESMKVRLNDNFMVFVNNSEQKSKTMDIVVDKLKDTDDLIKSTIEENKKLKSENKKLRELLNISENSYKEFWEIINVKMKNLFDKYKALSNINDINELNSFIESLKIELKVGIKPVEEKLKYIRKLQKDKLKFNSNDFLIEEEIIDVVKNYENEENKKPKTIKELSKENEENIKFNEQLKKLKEKEIENIEKTLDEDDEDDEEVVPEEFDDVIPEDEIEFKKIKKYTKFKVFNGKIYDEQDWITNEVMTQEEKDIRNTLIKLPRKNEDYMLESEVDYYDYSVYNKLKIITLVGLDSDRTHESVGVNCVQYKEIFFREYNFHLDDLKKLNYKFSDMTLSKAQKKYLSKLKKNERNDKKEKKKFIND